MENDDDDDNIIDVTPPELSYSRAGHFVIVNDPPSGRFYTIAPILPRQPLTLLKDADWYAVFKNVLGRLEGFPSQEDFKFVINTVDYFTVVFGYNKQKQAPMRDEDLLENVNDFIFDWVRPLEDDARQRRAWIHTFLRYYGNAAMMFFNTKHLYGNAEFTPVAFTTFSSNALANWRARFLKSRNATDPPDPDVDRALTAAEVPGIEKFSWTTLQRQGPIDEEVLAYSRTHYRNLAKKRRARDEAEANNPALVTLAPEESESESELIPDSPDSRSRDSLSNDVDDIDDDDGGGGVLDLHLSSSSSSSSEEEEDDELTEPLPPPPGETQPLIVEVSSSSDSDDDDDEESTADMPPLVDLTEETPPQQEQNIIDLLTPSSSGSDDDNVDVEDVMDIDQAPSPPPPGHYLVITAGGDFRLSPVVDSGFSIVFYDTIRSDNMRAMAATDLGRSVEKHILFQRTLPNGDIVTALVVPARIVDTYEEDPRDPSEQFAQWPGVNSAPEEPALLSQRFFFTHVLGGSEEAAARVREALRGPMGGLILFHGSRDTPMANAGFDMEGVRHWRERFMVPDEEEEELLPDFDADEPAPEPEPEPTTVITLIPKRKEPPPAREPEELFPDFDPDDLEPEPAVPAPVLPDFDSDDFEPEPEPAPAPVPVAPPPERQVIQLIPKPKPVTPAPAPAPAPAPTLNVITLIPKKKEPPAAAATPEPPPPARKPRADVVVDEAPPTDFDENAHPERMLHVEILMEKGEDEGTRLSHVLTLEASSDAPLGRDVKPVAARIERPPPGTGDTPGEARVIVRADKTLPEREWVTRAAAKWAETRLVHIADAFRSYQESPELLPYHAHMPTLFRRAMTQLVGGLRSFFDAGRLFVIELVSRSRAEQMQHPTAYIIFGEAPKTNRGLGISFLSTTSVQGYYRRRTEAEVEWYLLHAISTMGGDLYKKLLSAAVDDDKPEHDAFLAYVESRDDGAAAAGTATMQEYGQFATMAFLWHLMAHTMRNKPASDWILSQTAMQWFQPEIRPKNQDAVYPPLEQQALALQQRHVELLHLDAIPETPSDESMMALDYTHPQWSDEAHLVMVQPGENELPRRANVEDALTALNENLADMQKILKEVLNSHLELLYRYGISLMAVEALWEQLLGIALVEMIYLNPAADATYPPDVGNTAVWNAETSSLGLAVLVKKKGEENEYMMRNTIGLQWLLLRGLGMILAQSPLVYPFSQEAVAGYHEWHADHPWRTVPTRRPPLPRDLREMSATLFLLHAVKVYYVRVREVAHKAASWERWQELLHYTDVEDLFAILKGSTKDVKALQRFSYIHMDFAVLLDRRMVRKEFQTHQSEAQARIVRHRARRAAKRQKYEKKKNKADTLEVLSSRDLWIAHTLALPPSQVDIELFMLPPERHHELGDPMTLETLVQGMDMARNDRYPELFWDADTVEAMARIKVYSWIPEGIAQNPDLFLPDVHVIENLATFWDEDVDDADEEGVAARQRRENRVIVEEDDDDDDDDDSDDDDDAEEEEEVGEELKEEERSVDDEFDDDTLAVNTHRTTTHYMRERLRRAEAASRDEGNPKNQRVTLAMVAAFKSFAQWRRHTFGDRSLFGIREGEPMSLVVVNYYGDHNELPDAFHYALRYLYDRDPREEYQDGRQRFEFAMAAVDSLLLAIASIPIPSEDDDDEDAGEEKQQADTARMERETRHEEANLQRWLEEHADELQQDTLHALFSKDPKLPGTHFLNHEVRPILQRMLTMVYNVLNTALDPKVEPKDGGGGEAVLTPWLDMRGVHMLLDAGEVGRVFIYEYWRPRRVDMLPYTMPLIWYGLDSPDDDDTLGIGLKVRSYDMGQGAYAVRTLDAIQWLFLHSLARILSYTIPVPDGNRNEEDAYVVWDAKQRASARGFDLMSEFLAQEGVFGSEPKSRVYRALQFLVNIMLRDKDIRILSVDQELITAPTNTKKIRRAAIRAEKKKEREAAKAAKGGGEKKEREAAKAAKGGGKNPFEKAHAKAEEELAARQIQFTGDPLLWPYDRILVLQQVERYYVETLYTAEELYQREQKQVSGFGNPRARGVKRPTPPEDEENRAAETERRQKKQEHPPGRNLQQQRQPLVLTSAALLRYTRPRFISILSSSYPKK